MPSYADPERPRKNTFMCGMLTFVLCTFATIFGIASIVLASQANVCINPYSYSRNRIAGATKAQMKWTGITHNDANLQKNKEMGWYSAPTAVEGTKTHWIEGSPMNCITECQMNCTAAYTEGPMMLKRNKDGGCADCLRYCTHPWGKNIEDCHVSPNCTTAHANHKGIKNFCQPLAMCFQMCAGRGYKKIDARAGQTKYQSGPVGWNNAPKDGGTSGKAWTTAGYETDKDGKTKVAWYGPTGKSYRCIRECEYDGRLAVGFGIFALVVVWLAPLCLHIGSSYPEMHSVLSFLIASICWTASLILAADAFNLNMGRAKGRGWAMLYFENLPVDYEIIGGTTSSGQLKVTLNWMLHVIYGLALLANLFTVLAYYDPAEIWNRRPKPPKEDASQKEPTPIPSKPKPTAMSYYGEDQAKEEEMMAAGAAGLTGEGKNFPVEIGLTWTRSQHNNVSEVVIKEVIPGGPADEACKSGMNGKNVPQPGDVVLLVGNVVATDGREDRADMHNVYGQPYSDWKDVVFSQPGGTKIRFMFARHSEFMKYQFDIVRKNVGETEPAREVPEAASSRQPPAPSTDDIQAGAPVDSRI